MRNKNVYKKLVECQERIEMQEHPIMMSNIDNISLKIGLQFLYAAMGKDVYGNILELMPYLQGDITTTIAVTKLIARYLESTGIRISEALGLQFENVDYFNCRLHIVWQKGRTIQGDGWESHMATSQLIRPKTYSSIRSVELPQFVLDEIVLTKKNMII